MSAPPRTAVVTITHSRDTHLNRQRSGLVGQEPYVHVVVGMGERPTLDRLPAAPRTAMVRVPTTPAGLPLARARNIGAATAIEAGADLLIMLDVDCIPGPRLVERYRAAAAASASPALLCGPVAYLPPAPRGGYQDEGLAKLAKAHPARPVPPDGQLWHESRFELFWSVSFAVAAADWTALGGFCEDYTGYGGEDTDFAFTAAAAGAHLYWVGGAVAYHQHHPPSRHEPGRAAEIVRNAHLFRRRWGSWPMPGWLTELAGNGIVEFEPALGLLRLQQ